MTTYAHIDSNGFAVDIIITPPELATRFNADWLSRHPFIVVPDGTQHGAASDGQGGWINPPPSFPAVPLINTTFGATEFSAAIKRQASALAKKGQYQQALFLLKKNGL